MASEIYVELQDGTPEISVEIGGNAMINMQFDGRIDEILATKVSIGALLDMVYPVGSIYLSTANASPGSFLGGTWERIKDTFLLSAGDTYTAGDTGGEAAHTLTGAESGQKALSISGGTHSHSVKNLKTTVKAGTGSNVEVASSAGSSVTTLSNIANTTGTHSHSVSESNAASAHNNMPPYLVVHAWKRTA